MVTVEHTAVLVAYTSDHCLVVLTLPIGPLHNTWDGAMLYLCHQSQPTPGMRTKCVQIDKATDPMGNPVTKLVEVRANGYKVIVSHQADGSLYYFWGQRSDNHPAGWYYTLLRPLDTNHFVYETLGAERMFLLSRPRTIDFAGIVAGTDEIVAVTIVDGAAASAEFFAGQRTDGYADRLRVLKAGTNAGNPKFLNLTVGSRRFSMQSAATFRAAQPFWRRGGLPKDGLRVTFGDSPVEPLPLARYDFRLEQSPGRVTFAGIVG